LKKLDTLKDDERKLILDFQKKLKELYKNNLVKVILFGSRARGDFSVESDYDFLVVLKNIKNPFKEIERITDIRIEILQKTDKYLSAIPISKDEFESKKGWMFYENIRKDGIEV